jgi:HPt (histidine-containing phosphotransfer) domain-containing protein
MTLPELYQTIGGDYDQALRVLHIEKLIDKHIRKFPKNGVVDTLLDAGKTMDPTGLFETAHAVKGVCANLGLTALSDAAAEITEEFRPGNARKLSDAEIGEKLHNIEDMYNRIKEGIRQYEEG